MDQHKEIAESRERENHVHICVFTQSCLTLKFVRIHTFKPSSGASQLFGRINEFKYYFQMLCSFSFFRSVFLDIKQ